tara:strand:+ start:365 stop:1390 length:1026 start_codon:yes stop_codon:yes gene_type:complete
MYLYSNDRIGFAVTLLPNSLDEFVSWCRTAEVSGFNAVGIGDSQSLYRETFLASALALQNTSDIKVGPRVINPITRHPAVSASGVLTLEEIAPGRALLGIGTGDSSVHNAGVKPANMARTKDYTIAIKELLTEGETIYQGETARLTWGRADIPVYVAASGPKTLELAGEVADGVIIQTGLLPEVVEDALNCIKRGAERAGRDFNKIDKTWFPWVNVAANKEEAIENILHSLASGAKHLGRFTTKGKHIPESMVPLIEKVYAEYKFEQHQIPGNDNGKLIKKLGLAEYLADRFAIVGNSKDCARKVAEAAEAGARHFWMSVHFPDKEDFMREWNEKVIKTVN